MSVRRSRNGRAVLVAALVASGCASSIGATAVATQACGSGVPVAGRSLQIVTTVAPLTSIIANIAGGTDAQVTGIVPEGTNSHTFEPPPSSVQAIAKADVVFINGLKLEDPIRRLAAANLPVGAEICELASTVLPESEWIYDFSFPKSGGKPNPHLWTNPPLAKRFADVVRSTLAARDPANAASYAANYEAFAVKIDALDRAVATATASIPPADRQLLTYHDAYAYFARQYGWTVVGAIQPSSFAVPSPKDVADLIEQVTELKVKAVFGSEVFPSPVLEQIGAETGATYVDVLRDDDLPGAPGDPEHSWLGLMRFDFVTMVDALGGDASGLRDVDIADVAPDRAGYPQ